MVGMAWSASEDGSSVVDGTARATASAGARRVPAAEEPDDLAAVARALRHASEHAGRQPDVAELARVAGLGETRFSRACRELAGITPKGFVQALTLATARERLARARPVLETSLRAGLSGGSRLHDLFVGVERMTPGEYARAGAGLVLAWDEVATPFGPALVCAAPRGVCALSFTEGRGLAAELEHARARWPRAAFVRDGRAIAPAADSLRSRLAGRAADPSRPITLLLKGTDFEVRVWEALLAIPEGLVASYGGLARARGAAFRPRRRPRDRREPDRGADPLPPRAARDGRPGRLPLGRADEARAARRGGRARRGAADGRRMNRGYVYRHRVQGADAGLDLLAYHARRFPKRSLAEWRASIEAGQVHVNGRPAAVADHVSAGDHVEFHRPPWDEPDAPTELGIVYEDEHVLVVLKPAGLQVLPAGPFLEKTVYSIARRSAPDRAEAAPVHRLGRGTSGLMLLGKTFLARAELSRQFRERTPTKTYFALVEGCDLPASCRARHPIGDVAHGQLRIHVAREGGRPSLTRVRVLRRDRERGRTLVAAQPVTGRPDQIRVHLAALGAPIVGDPLFGPGGTAKSDATPGAGGYHLHAAGIGFVHPATGERVKLRSRPAWFAP